MNFKNLPISSKIAAGSATTLVLTIILALAGWYGVQMLVSKMDSSQGLANTLAKMNDVSRAKAIYIASPNEERAQEVDKFLVEVKESLLSDQDAEAREQVEVARSAIDQFSTSFGGLVTALQNIKQRDAEITEARINIRTVGDELANDAKSEELNFLQAVQKQQQTADRSNLLAFEVGDVAENSLAAQLTLDAYFSGIDNVAMDRLEQIQKTANKLFDASITPEVDQAAAVLKQESDQTIALVKSMKETNTIDLPKATAAIQQMIEHASALKQAFFTFIEKTNAEKQALEREALKTRGKAQIGTQFARDAMEVASELGDYRADPSDAKQQAIEKRIGTLKGLNGAVKAMTDKDAGSIIAKLETAFQELVQSQKQLEEALDNASQNEGLASQTLNQLMNENKEQADSIAMQAILTIIVAFIFSIAFAALLTFALWILISRPLVNLTQQTLRVADGDMDVDLDAHGRKDEIGQLVDAMAIFRDNLIQNQRLEEEQKKAQIRQSERQAQVDRLIEEFRTEVRDVLSGVSQNLDELQTTASAMTKLAENSVSRSSSVAEASQDASHNVDAVASAAEQLASSIDEISRQATVAMQTVVQASGMAATANEKISQLAEAAQTIGEVISLISQIAEQTNLLALNATIEAARAGEAGKGFAVVAAEVKGLATQTSQATERIAAQIAEIQSETTDAVKAIGTIAMTMDEVNRYTDAIATAVNQQGGATSNISRNVLQAADRTRSVAETITEVNGSSAQTKNAADQVLTVSSNVSERALKLKSRIDRFLQDVAAA